MRCSRCERYGYSYLQWSGMLADMRRTGHRFQNTMLGALALGFSVVFGKFASWAITELFKGAVQDWIKEKLGAFTGVGEAEVLAAAATVAVPALIFFFGIYATVLITKHRMKIALPGPALPPQSHSIEPSNSTETVTKQGQALLDKSADAIATLAGLGWTVKPTQDAIQFELIGRLLPPMKESTECFVRLDRPFKLHLQNVASLEGLHHLANVPGCKDIEISACEFTDISELHGFIHLTRLVILQVPLAGTGVVNTSILSSLIALRELRLDDTRVKDLRFLSHMPGLEKLSVGNTLVDDSVPLYNLAGLKSLDIKGTRIVDLKPIGQSKFLKELRIGARQVPSLLDLANVSTLTNLQVFLDRDAVEMSPIGHLSQLEALWIWGPRSHLDISPLQNLTKLKNFTLMGLSFPGLLNVAGFNALGRLTELRQIVLGHLQISDISFMVSLKNLEEIDLRQLPITTIEPLRALKNLRVLSFNQTHTVDISPLLDAKKLVQLTVVRTPARSDVLAELQRQGVAVTNH